MTVVGSAIDAMLSNAAGGPMLEAGGGSASYFLWLHPSSVTTIDISFEQLERNDYATARIYGDVHDVVLPEAAFGSVVLFNVVEHLVDPARALKNLTPSLLEGGVLIIGAPLRSSLGGLITRLTPHWFHVAVLRHVFGSPTAGLPDYPPFPTVHHRDIEPGALVGKLAELGLEPLCLVAYESVRPAALKRRSYVVWLGYRIAVALWNGVQIVTVSPSRPPAATDTDFILVARKNGGAGSAAAPQGASG